MEQNNQSLLLTEKLGKLMGKYAVPCIISLLAGALYNIVDQIFIANADYLGSYGNAANTVVFPPTVIALGIAVMIGNGCCAFVSQALGANRSQDAHRHLWRTKRERLLHGLCGQELPHLSVHDAPRHGQQGIVHLFAGAGQDRPFHNGFPDP